MRFNSPVYSLVIPGQEQTSRNSTRKRWMVWSKVMGGGMIERQHMLYMCMHTLFTVYAPAEFHLPLMKLFVFMTSCHPGELNET